MKWGDITELHPSRFVLVEAIQASSNNRVRQLEDLAVVQDYDDPREAWSGYKHFHKLHPTRELYVFHTSRSDVEVVEPELRIEHFALNDFPIQLGSIQESYGFDGILGIDFMVKAKCRADFETMEITFAN